MTTENKKQYPSLQKSETNHVNVTGNYKIIFNSILYHSFVVQCSSLYKLLSLSTFLYQYLILPITYIFQLQNVLLFLKERKRKANCVQVNLINFVPGRVIWNFTRVKFTLKQLETMYHFLNCFVLIFECHLSNQVTVRFLPSYYIFIALLLHATQKHMYKYKSKNVDVALASEDSICVYWDAAFYFVILDFNLDMDWYVNSLLPNFILKTSQLYFQN